jgi:23S rRNA (adenine2503-C2)-methyltransferase
MPPNFNAWAMSPEALASSGLGRHGLPSFRMLQRPWRWGSGGPVFGKRICEQLSVLGTSLPQVVETIPSDDGATKLLLGVESELFEAVHIPRSVGTSRVTICLSSQVGCGMGCRFCATARMGLKRQLSAGEIVAQLLLSLHQLGPRHPSDLTLVFMGMGEPLANWSAVYQAIEIFCHPQGLGISPRRITLSTSGILPEITRFARSKIRPLLAISLNATTDETRRQVMPISQTYSLEDLRKVLLDYPLRPRERITVEYVLLRGINDTKADAERLANYVVGFAHQINLIVYNEFTGSPYFTPTDDEIDAFARAILATRPTLVTVRRSRGRDIQAACGQLARKQARTKVSDRSF